MSSASSAGQVAQLYEDLRPRLDHYLNAILKNEADAEDARQESFIAIWKNYALVDEPSKFLMRVAHHVACMKLRSPWRCRRVTFRGDSASTEQPGEQEFPDELHAQGPDADTSEVEDIYIRARIRELSPVLLAEINRLPKKERTAIRLRFLHDEDIADICLELYGCVNDKKRQCVSGLLNRGLKKLSHRRVLAPFLHYVQ